MARKLRRSKRRILRLPEYAVVALLAHGHDHFNDLPGGFDDPDNLVMLRNEWARPHIREAVLAEWARFNGHFGEFCWAQKRFDGAVEDPAKVAAREKSERAKTVEYILNCLAMWQIEEQLTDEEKIEHADRIEWLREFKTQRPRPGTQPPAPAAQEIE